MGASMTGIIEWTHDAHCAIRPEFGISLSEPRWHDDHLHGILFETDKEYEFFGAIAGVRGRCKTPLISPRGVPAHLSIPAANYFRDYGAPLAGWLHLSEIDGAIDHTGIPPEEFLMDLDLEIALDLMRRLVAKLTDPHVRLVFDIESA
jgi:hypothetical protein